MLLPGAKAPTFRQCSGVCCRVWVISPLSGPSHIAYAAWSGRFFIRESATSSKASNPNQSSSSIVPNTWQNNFVNLAITSRSLLQTELQYKTRGSNSGGGDFRWSCPRLPLAHFAQTLRAVDGQTAPYWSLAVRPRNGRVADYSGLVECSGRIRSACPL